MCSVIDLMSVVSILAVSSFGAEDLVLLDLFIIECLKLCHRHEESEMMKWWKKQIWKWYPIIRLYHFLRVNPQEMSQKQPLKWHFKKYLDISVNTVILIVHQLEYLIKVEVRGWFGCRATAPSSLSIVNFTIFQVVNLPSVVVCFCSCLIFFVPM